MTKAKIKTANSIQLHRYRNLYCRQRKLIANAFYLDTEIVDKLTSRSACHNSCYVNMLDVCSQIHQRPADKKWYASD